MTSGCSVHLSPAVTNLALLSGILQSQEDAVLCTRKCTACLWAHGMFHTTYSATKNITHHGDAQWGRNVPGLALFPQWIRAASSSQAQDQVLCINSTQKRMSNFLSEGIFSFDSAWLKQGKRACALLSFCVLLSHSSQWADVRRLFTFGSIPACRLHRKYCTTPDNCPNTSKSYILLSLNLKINLEVIPDLLPYWFFVFIVVRWNPALLAASVGEEHCHIIKSVMETRESWIKFPAQTPFLCTSKHQPFLPLAFPCVKQRWWWFLQPIKAGRMFGSAYNKPHLNTAKGKVNAWPTLKAIVVLSMVRHCKSRAVTIHPKSYRISTLCQTNL